MDEFPLSDLIKPASLKKFAVTRLALDLWRQNGPQVVRLVIEIRRNGDKYFSCQEMIQVALPSSIKELIDERIHLLGQELAMLCGGFDQYCFLDKSCILPKCLDSFTYGPDGKLCAERSAKNLLICPELTDLQKFEIACVYWFENDIRQIWPSLTDHLRKKSFPRYSLSQEMMNHWIKKMKNVQSDVSANCNDFYSILFFCRSFYIQCFQNWSALICFQNILSVDRQNNLLLRLFEECGNNGTKHLLSKLNGVQVRYLLGQCSHRIMQTLALDLDSLEHVLRIWNFVRDIINGEGFFSIIKCLCCNVYNWPTRYHLRENITELQENLLEVWTTAPNQLKTEFFRVNVGKLFHALSKIDIQNRKFCYGYNHNDEKFISMLFSGISFEERTKIWHSCWRGIVLHSSTEYQNHLLRLCLRDDDIKRFVEEEMLNFAKVEPIIHCWWASQMYDLVINYSKLCSWNEHLAREFRNKIFSSSIPSSPKIFDYDKLIKLDLAIDECLSSVEETKDAKRTIFFSDSVKGIVKLKLKTGLAKDVINVVDRLLSTERSSHEKQIFLDQWCKFLAYNRNGRYDFGRWKEFLSWWMDNKDDLPIFKKFLPVDSILEKLLLEAVENLSLRLSLTREESTEYVLSSNYQIEEFARVDDFLFWYFGDEVSVKDYKRSMILKYRQIAGLKKLLLDVKNECILNHIILWFFNGDLAEIRRFRLKYKRKNAWWFRTYSK